MMKNKIYFTAIATAIAFAWKANMFLSNFIKNLDSFIAKRSIDLSKV